MSLSQPSFLSSEGHAIFALRDEPPAVSARREGVVICPPAPHELKKFHWTLRQLAVRLAAAGYSVLRFDYYGSGDSEGLSADFNQASCVQNIRDAIQSLKASGDVRRITVIAPRLSALWAADALREERVRKLVLLDPVEDSSDYIAQLDMMHQKLLHDDASRAPFPLALSSHRQRLGFPQDELFRQTKARSGLLKIKSLHVVTTEGEAGLSQAVLSAWADSFEDISQTQVAENLRWSSYQGLQFQDFPNQTIAALIQAVGGEG